MVQAKFNSQKRAAQIVYYYTRIEHQAGDVIRVCGRYARTTESWLMFWNWKVSSSFFNNGKPCINNAARGLLRIWTGGITANTYGANRCCRFINACHCNRWQRAGGRGGSSWSTEAIVCIRDFFPKRTAIFLTIIGVSTNNWRYVVFKQTINTQTTCQRDNFTLETPPRHCWVKINNISVENNEGCWMFFQ